MESTIVNKNTKMMMLFNLILGGTGLYLWWIIYHTLPRLSSWLTYSLLPIETGSHLGSSIEFFFYDTPKVMMLLFLKVNLQEISWLLF